MSLAMTALLLASVQCLSACTLASCTPSPREAQFPPCHQHKQAPVSNQHDNCDHQKAVNAPSADMTLAHLAFALAPSFIPLLSAAVPVASLERVLIESPPGITAVSVLRI